jgi:dCMP deaminase
LEVAQTFAQRSPDLETKLGAVLVSKTTGAVMGMAFNGFVRKANDKLLPKTRPKKYDFMIHAEQNLICNAARHGVSTSDCFVVCTLSPCIHCMRLLYQAGVNEIYYKDTYRDFAQNLQMKDLLIVLTNMGEYTKINLRSKKR